MVLFELLRLISSQLGQLLNLRKDILKKNKLFFLLFFLGITKKCRQSILTLLRLLENCSVISNGSEIISHWLSWFSCHSFDHLLNQLNSDSQILLKPLQVSSQANKLINVLEFKREYFKAKEEELLQINLLILDWVLSLLVRKNLEKIANVSKG